MRKITTLLALLICIAAFAQEKEDKKKEIIKTGYNFGPFPVVGFDADKGFGIGALCNIFDFGDGSTYPNPRQQWYVEASYYTKGTQLYFLSYDSRHLIPGVRTSIAGQVVADNALPFTGFNGYRSFYDHERINNKDLFRYNPYYQVARTMANLKADFSGNITKDGKLKWVAGYHFKWDKYSERNLSNEKYDEFNQNVGTSLYANYKKWGLIPEAQHDGGITSSLRAGLIFDTRDVENNPSRGIWAEGQLIAAPKFLGSSVPYYSYTLVFRHYVPIIPKRLTFAYRLNYHGIIGKETPFYSMPYMTIMGKGYDRDAIGGFHTVRGMMRNRVNAPDMGFYNAEFRWRFIDFKLFNQNIAFALNAFNDGAISTRYYDMSYKGDPNNAVAKAEYDEYMSKGQEKDSFHFTVGGGLRFIMNENFILAGEYGVPLNKQDGKPSFYLNVGYLF